MINKIKEVYKDIYLTLDHDGDIWAIPAWIIVLNRIKYIEYFKTKEEFDLTEEIGFIDNDIIEDWAINNMNWRDFKDTPFKYKSLRSNISEVWSNCDAEILTIPNMKEE